MIHTPYVIDASVYVARSRRSEPGFADSVALLQRIDMEQWQVYLPSIALPEVAGNIARTTGKLSFARHVLIILLQPYVEIIDVDVTMGQFAANLAMQHRIRGCDAVYVALAQMRNAVLITLDQEQRQRVPPGVTARTPAEELGFLQSLNN
ncbi:MAG: type II toxin-antitoxin system VapC family toxin [Chloroflexi bacterium]|nr:type II toxin-antitoxin system VapC family toxin [Chloroflexota bacterium]